MKLSIAVQAGGKSTRMGQDKAFVLLHGKPLIQHVIERVQQLNADELFIVANSDQYAALSLPVYADKVENKGPLGGIVSALEYARNDNVLVVACDMPFLDAGLLAYLAAQLHPPTQAVVPRLHGIPQGLHALYHRSCLPTMQQCLNANMLRLSDVFAKLQVLYLDEPDYQHLDANGRSFTNLNTPAELIAAFNHLPLE